MPDARVTEHSAVANATAGVVGSEVDAEAAIAAQYDRFWGKYKVPWEFYETPEPSGETKLQLQSLGLWKPGHNAAQDNMATLVREDQRQLKQSKKRKDKPEDEEEEEEEEPSNKTQKVQAKPEAKGKAQATAKAKAKGKAKATPKARAKKAVDAEEGAKENPGQPPSPPAEPPSACLAIVPVQPTASSSMGNFAKGLLEIQKKRRRRAGDEGYKPSFARRVQPTGERASTQWLAIKDAFNMIIRRHVEGCASTHEDRHSKIAVYIYMHVFIYTNKYKYVYRHCMMCKYIRIYTHMYVCVYVRMYARMHARVCMHACMYVHVLYVYIYICIHICMYTYRYVCLGFGGLGFIGCIYI